LQHELLHSSIIARGLDKKLLAFIGSHDFVKSLGSNAVALTESLRLSGPLSGPIPEQSRSTACDTRNAGRRLFLFFRPPPRGIMTKDTFE
jgi:hypothetical protein